MRDADPGSEIVLDLEGLKCPQPVLRIRRALAGMAPGCRLVAICTDPMAAIDVPHFLQGSGDQLTEAKRDGSRLTFSIVRGSSGPTPPASAERVG